MQMNMDQARLDVSANTARTPRETFYPPPIQSQPPPRAPEILNYQRNTTGRDKTVKISEDFNSRI